MHIVVLTGYYYPYLLPPVGCVKPYLLELAKEHEVEVLCPPSNIHFTESIVRNGIKINYVNSIPNKFLAYIKTNQEEHKLPHFTKLCVTIYRGLRYLKSLVTKNPYETSLIGPYIKTLQAIHAENKIDVMLSVSFPFHTHVAALKFKKINPDVRWVSYSTDPLAYSESNPIERWKLKEAIKIEQAVYDNSDKCLITEELLENLRQNFHIEEKKIFKLPYLLFEEIEDRSVKDRQKPMVLYAGFVFYTVRNPEIMLSAFSKVKDIELHLYISGDRQCRAILERPLPDHIIKNDLVPHAKYIELLGQAEVLINLSNKAHLQAPHKLMELISTGKPIINFYYYEDSGYDIINKYPLGINISNDWNEEDMVKSIEHFVAENCHKRVSYEEITQLYSEHLLENQLPRFKEVILK